MSDQFFKPDPNSIHARDRADINRENAQKSSGPSTPEGKAISSLNALKHGLTGNTVLVKSDDADAYQRRLDEYVELHKPVTVEERYLVQSIHDLTWRLDRITNMESTIFAKGRFELEGCYYGQPEDQRDSYINLDISERYDKQLRNLYLLEARLTRQRNRNTATLAKLLAERKKEEAAAAELAKTMAKTQPKPHPESEPGFEFSSSQSCPSHIDSATANPLDEAA
jgi:hypothetical protein